VLGRKARVMSYCTSAVESLFGGEQDERFPSSDDEHIGGSSGIAIEKPKKAAPRQNQSGDKSPHSKGRYFAHSRCHNSSTKSDHNR
jgi:hypothetical protein